MLSWLPGRRDAADEDTGDSAPSVIRTVELRMPTARQRRSLPAFQGLVGRSRPQSQTELKLERTRARVREVFAPTQPVTDTRVFAGRVPTLKQLIEVIEHRMSHVVIFGERGIGKTSLLHILGGLAENSDYIVLRGTCGGKSEFTAMFRAMLRNVPLRFHSSVSPTAEMTESGAALSQLLPEGDFDARELSEVLGSVTSTRLLILLDEYDRIESEAFRQSIAELIKNLSDVAARVHLVIAGVSSNLDELIGYIPSIRRNVMGIAVQRLTADEVREIIAIGEEGSGLSFAAGAVERIALLANGSPYLVRLVAYHASMIALDQERFDVGVADVGEALERMIEEIESRLPVTVSQRARQLDVGALAEPLAQLSRIAGTPRGWFVLDGEERLHPQLPALVEKLLGLGLIERRPGGEVPALRFVDEGLATFFWILAARAGLAGRTEPARPRTVAVGA